MVKKILISLRLFGVDLVKIFENLKGLPFYLKDLKEIKKRNKEKKFGGLKYYPILHERFLESGSMSGHYFHQDLLVAQKIYNNSPNKHVDIGSRIDGFVSNVAVFRNIEIFDIRKQKSLVDNIVFKQIDFMKELPKEYNDYCDSISALHSLEHFGLGRYGDSIDIEGHIRGLDNIYKVLKKGGIFYLSVPIGEQRIEFNAHRVFSVSYLLDLLQGKYDLLSFSFVDDSGDLHKNINMNREGIKSSFGCHYGCGIFELRKK